MTLTTQTVLLSNANFTLSTAKNWIKKHDFKLTFYGKQVDTTENYFRFRQMAPSRFKKINMQQKK